MHLALWDSFLDENTYLSQVALSSVEVGCIPIMSMWLHRDSSSVVVFVVAAKEKDMQH